MRALMLVSFAALTVAALPAQAREEAKPFPTPTELRLAVDREIAKGGIGWRDARDLRIQADDIMKLESRYAADRYSKREQLDIRQRSLYLIQNVLTAKTGQVYVLDAWDTSDPAVPSGIRTPSLHFYEGW